MVNDDYIGISYHDRSEYIYCTALHGCSLCIDFEDAGFGTEQNTFRH